MALAHKDPRMNIKDATGVSNLRSIAPASVFRNAFS